MCLPFWLVGWHGPLVTPPSFLPKPLRCGGGTTRWASVVGGVYAFNALINYYEVFSSDAFSSFTFCAMTVAAGGAAAPVLCTHPLTPSLGRHPLLGRSQTRWWRSC